MRNWRFMAPRRTWRLSTAVLACLVAAPSLVYAHGGMAGPDELGPPIFTSGLLGFVCYWLVMLWPSAKKKDNVEVGSGTQPKSITRTRRRVRRVALLRKIEKNGQLGNGQNSGRRAIDA